jgi:serine/threonine protein kinase
MNESAVAASFATVGELVQRLQALWESGQNPDADALLEAAGVSLPAEVAKVLAADQWHRWQAGECLAVESYFARHPFVAADPAAALILVYGEFLVREERGETPLAADYITRFPQCAAGLHRQLDFHAAVGTASLTVSELDAAEVALSGAYPDIPGYTILGVLGRGGMGIVYRAFDEKRGVPVALKTLKKVDSAAILRFKQEFRSLADMSHPNLVVLHELTADRTTWFFTMELVDGVDFRTFVRSGTDRPAADPETTEEIRPTPTNLPDLLQSAEDAIRDIDSFDSMRLVTASLVLPPARRHSLSPAALARLRIALKQLAEGVAVLHEAGTLHRDLKPSNVLVTRKGRVVIVDFGLAADMGASGLHQSLMPYVLGTSAYMSPEQAAGRPVSPASDWYSLGSMLYEVLTGHPPFVGRADEILMKKQRIEPPAPRELAPGIPDDLNALCVDLLRRDPAARPTGAVVLRRLGSVTTEPKLSIPSGAAPHQLGPLVGRARELESLEVAFADVGRGQTVALYIHGPSGVGKTALVQRFLDEKIGRDKAIVLAGRCYQQESVPYKALDSVVDALSRYLTRLPLTDAQALLPGDIRSLVRVFPTLGQAEAVATAPQVAPEVPDPRELRRQAFGALREVLARLGDRHPLILAIDDLQWGDSDSAVLLSELLRPPDAPRLLLLGCYRSDDAQTSPPLRALLTVHDGGGPRIDRRVVTLGTLDSADAEELALFLLDRQDEVACALAAAIARESGGSPFFVAELVRHIQADSGLLQRAPGADEVALDEVLWARVRRLPEEARRLLEIVAVSGRPIGLADAASAAELGLGEQRALPLLRSGRLIRSTGLAERDEVETYHDRVREAVVARVPRLTLVGHHLRLAQVLESSGRADPEVLAVHFHGAGERDRAGIHYAHAAAQAAQALAFDRAAKLYRLALELRPGDDDEVRRLRVGLADALANAGRGPDAAGEYVAAAAGATAVETLECRRRAATQYLISGHLDEGLAQLGAVLKAVGTTLPATPWLAVLSLILHRLRIHIQGLHFRRREPSRVSAEGLTRIDVCWAAASGLGIIDPIRGADFQARGLLLALRAGEPFRIGRALCYEACHASSAGRPSQRYVGKVLRAFEEIVAQLDDPYLCGGVFLAQGVAAYMLGQWKHGGELLDKAGFIHRNQCTGAFFEIDSASLFSLWSIQFRGEVADLGRRWAVVLKEAEERGDRHVMTNLNTMLMSTLRLAADDPDGTEARLSEVMGQWSQQGFHVQHNEWHGAVVQIKLYRGDGDGAWRFVETRYGPSLTRSHLMRVQKIKIFFLERRARCALAAAALARDARPLLKSAERDARRLDREGMGWSKALAYPINAGVAAARGDRSQAAALCAEAVQQLEAVDMNLYAASSRRRLGEILGGDEGRAQVERADSWMRQQGIQNPARMADVFAPVVA